MSHGRRGSILPFPSGRRAPAAERGVVEKAVVLPLRARERDPEAGGGTWDELTRLALDAWCWRDPESLARLEACIGRLWVDVNREWGDEARRIESDRDPVPRSGSRRV